MLPPPLLVVHLSAYDNTPSPFEEFASSTTMLAVFISAIISLLDPHAVSNQEVNIPTLEPSSILVKAFIDRSSLTEPIIS